MGIPLRELQHCNTAALQQREQKFAVSKPGVCRKQRQGLPVAKLHTFLLKKVAEIFGGFKYYLYLCSIIRMSRKAG